MTIFCMLSLPTNTAFNMIPNANISKKKKRYAFILSKGYQIPYHFCHLFFEQI